MNRREVAETIASTYGDGSVITCESSDMIAAIEAALRERDIRASQIAEEQINIETDYKRTALAQHVAAAILNEEAK